MKTTIFKTVNKKLYRIDKNIPVPSAQGTWKCLAEAMDPKDEASVFFKQRNQAIALLTLLNKMKMKGTMRKWKRGFRVWRVR